MAVPPADAMLYVVVEELIPETVRSDSVDIATLAFIGGFTVVMSPQPVRAITGQSSLRPVD
jgi:hypothetical protein